MDVPTRHLDLRSTPPRARARRSVRWRAARCAVMALAVPVLVSCDADPPTAPDPPLTPRATTIALSKTAVTFDARGETEQLTATVLDQFGLIMPGATVAWSSTAAAVATVSDGLITAAGPGSAQIAARVDSASASAEVRVVAVPSRIVALDGALRVPPGGDTSVTVRVFAWDDSPASGHPVRFHAAQGQGTLSGDTTRVVTTDTEGRASVTWTVPEAGGSYRLTAVADFQGHALSGSPVAVTGTVVDCSACTLPDSLFVLVPAGTFQMGSADGLGDERPVHSVTITRPFYLGRTEVTQGQWRKVMGSNPSHFSDCGDDCPVEFVNWNEIQDFIAKLNELNPGARYRLPTEAEWEYAARAGTSGAYGGTGDVDEMGWYEANAGDGTHRVAQKKPNAWGLYDMHGNVWEWTQDWYSPTYYASSPAEDPQGPASGEMRVLRGGAWRDPANALRSAFRNYGYQTPRSFGDGFRLARTR